MWKAIIRVLDWVGRAQTLRDIGGFGWTLITGGSVLTGLFSAGEGRSWDTVLLVTMAAFLALLVIVLIGMHIRESRAESSTGNDQWLAQEARFEKIEGEVEALWAYYPESGDVR